MTKVTVKMVREKLHVDTASYKNGVFTVRRGFFYTHGGTAEKLCNAVMAAFPEAYVVDSGEVWKSFRGGASVANQSHWFVKFTFGSGVVCDEVVYPGKR